MTRPTPAPAAPDRSFARLPGSVLSVIELLVLGAVLALAWKAWRVWPAIPIADPDTWGYLNPSLSWLSGLGFRQAGGRDWLYPAFVALFLKTSGSFAGIVVWQKFLGLLAGVFMAATWRCWTSLLPLPRFTRFVVSLVGAVPIFVQLVNPQGISFQMSIRPEAIVPCFVYAQLACLLGYARFRWQIPRALPSLLLGAAALVLAYTCLLLKPSWYLAAMVTPLPVLIGCFGRALPLRTRLLTPALGVAASLVILWLPPRLFFVRDGASVTLLPLALFCVHAPLIDQSIEARLATLPDSDPEKAKLQTLDDALKQEIRVSTEHSPYEVLGINPDYLLESRPLNLALFDCAGHDVEKIKAFCFRSYAGAVMYDPAAYGRKVFLQFDHFLFPDPKTFFKNGTDIEKDYRLAAEAMEAHRPVALRPDVGEMVRRYEEGLATQLATPLKPQSHPRLSEFGKFVAHWALRLELLFFPILAATLVWRPLHPLRLGGWAALFLFSAPLANAFGICIVHALDIYRYRATYGGFLLFALMAMAVFIFVVLAQSLVFSAAKISPRS